MPAPKEVLGRISSRRIAGPQIRCQTATPQGKKNPRTARIAAAAPAGILETRKWEA
jgi:hypothetical protein